MKSRVPIVVLNILYIILLAAVGWLMYMNYDWRAGNKQMAEDISNLKTQVQALLVKNPQTEIDNMLGFFQTETEKYRSTIEKQQDVLFWMLGLIGAATAGLLTFFGLKNRSEINKLVEDECKNEMIRQIRKAVNDEGNLDYLRSRVQKDKAFKKSKVLVLQQANGDCELSNVIKHLKNIFDSVDTKMVMEHKHKPQINSDNFDIIIYEVGKTEISIKRDDPAISGSYYPYLNSLYDSTQGKPLCLFYVTNGFIDTSKFGLHAVTANTPLTIISNLNTLLMTVN